MAPGDGGEYMEIRMKRAANKAERLLQIEQLLLAHPEGLTQAELARRLGVNRSTILRNLADASRHIYEEPDGRLKIDHCADLINLRLNLHEALAMHLGGAPAGDADGSAEPACGGGPAQTGACHGALGAAHKRTRPACGGHHGRRGAT